MNTLTINKAMTKRIKAEMILEDFRNGYLDEYDARCSLRRLDGLSNYEVERIVRDVEYGYKDPYDGAREFERQSYRAELRREEREREEREYCGY